MFDGGSSFQPIKLPHSAHHFVILWCEVQRVAKLSAVVFRYITRNKLWAESEADLLTLTLALFLYYTRPNRHLEQEISTAADSKQQSFLGLLEGKHGRFQAGKYSAARQLKVQHTPKQTHTRGDGGRWWKMDGQVRVIWLQSGEGR